MENNLVITAIVAFIITLNLNAQKNEEMASIEDSYVIYSDHKEIANSEVKYFDIPSIPCFEDETDLKVAISHQNNQTYFKLQPYANGVAICRKPLVTSLRNTVVIEYRLTNGVIVRDTLEEELETLWNSVPTTSTITFVSDKQPLCPIDESVTFGFITLSECNIINTPEPCYVQLFPTNRDCGETTYFNLADYSCQPSPSAACPLNEKVTAKKVGSNLVLETNNITQSQFENLVQGLNISDIQFFIQDTSGEHQATIPFYSSNNSSFNVELWSETIHEFGNSNNFEISTIIILSNGTTYNCYNNIDLIATSSSDLCNILSLLRYEKELPDGIMFSFNDSNNPSYFTDGLAALGFSLSQAQQILVDNAFNLHFALQYSNAGGQINTLSHSESTAGMAIQNLRFIISPISYSQLYGNLDISYSRGDAYTSCSSITVEFVQEPDAPHSDLPDLNCGIPVAIDPPSGIQGTLVVGDIFFANGIPVLVNSIINSASPYSGSGIISIPIIKKHIKVDFSNIVVSNNYIMTGGQVIAVTGNPASYPNFNIPIDTFNIGGDICVPLPVVETDDDDGFDDVTGLNERGFHADGTHENGTLYDDNGFDINGVHANNTLYDEWGCNVDRLDSLGQPCSPTLDDQIINQFIDSVKTTTYIIADSLVNNLSSGWLDSLQALNCAQIRTDILNLIDQTGLNSKKEYIVGQNNEYVDSSMVQYFNSPPKPMVNQIQDRDPKVVLIENKHIDLYQCNVLKSNYDKLISGMDQLGQDKVKSIIDTALDNLTAHQVQNFKNHPDQYQDWIVNLLNAEIARIYGTGSVNDDEKYQNSLIDPFGTKKNYSSAFYGLTSNIDFPYESKSEKDENIWLFNQGFKKINDVDRALYLEELYENMHALGGGEEDAISMPIKIAKTIDGNEYAIYLDNLTLGVSTASVDAYFLFKPSQTNKKFVLKATGIQFDGSGFIGQPKLSLESAVEIRLSNTAMLRLLPSDSTYISFDCNGFNSFGIKGEIELCPNIIRPLDPLTFEPLADTINYKISFTTILSKWTDFYLTFNDQQNCKPFIVVGYDKVKWSLQNVVIDMSDNKSPSNISILPGYTSPYLNGTSLSPQWRGFALTSLSAKMPGMFNSSSAPVEIAVQSVIIDEQGFSGQLSVQNLLSLNDGNLGGWPISVNKLRIDIIHNNLAGGGFGGEIQVPVFDSTMMYEASMYPDGKIELTVTPNLTQDMSLFLAEVHLAANSSITLAYKDGDFTAIANLNGNLSINGPIDIDSVTFTGFRVSNKSPYFDPGKWGVSKDIGFKLLGFGINISEILPFKKSDGDVGLGFSVELNLVDALGIKAKGGFEIAGNLEIINERQKWKYKEFNVNEFAIDVDFSAGHLKGKLRRYEDHTIYGKGFQGTIDFEIKSLGRVTAYGQFGSLPNYKYMYIDAQGKLSVGISAGPLTIDGFTGGYSYHMKQEFNQNGGATTNGFPQLGGSISGATIYNPNVNIGAGFKAGLLLSLAGQKTLFNGTVEFSMEFNSGGGINNIGLNGTGQFMSIKQIKSVDTSLVDGVRPPGSDAYLSAYLRISYDFNNKELHGNFHTYLNLGLLKGVGNDGKFVTAEVHFASNDWWVYIGKPKDPCGATLTVPLIGNAPILAYFDMGTKVPEMREIPENVRKIVNLTSVKNVFNGMSQGFVFGAEFNFKAELDVAIAKAKLEAGIGLDISVRKYANLSCGSYDPIGFEGWYARGQMYAYLNGQVEVFGINLLKAGLAAVLQARMPRPFYAQANVGIKVKLVFVNVKVNMELKLGDKCLVVDRSDPNEPGIEIISNIDPGDGERDVRQDRAINVTFGIPYAEKFEVPQITNNGTDIFELRNITYSAIDKFGNNISLREYKASANELRLIPNTYLNSNDSITFRISVELYKNNSKIKEVAEVVTFFTKSELNYLSKEDIATSYPIDGMNNFYKNQYVGYKGFIELERGMPELFYNIPEGMDQKMLLTSSNGKKVAFDYEYDPIMNKISFVLDPAWFENEHIYKLELIRTPIGGHPSTIGSKHADFEGFTANLFSNPLPNSSQAEAVDSNYISLVALYFRCSSFNNINDKLALLTTKSSNSKSVLGEDFDEIEKNLFIGYKTSLPDGDKLYSIFDHPNFEVDVKYLLVEINKVKWRTIKLGWFEQDFHSQSDIISISTTNISDYIITADDMNKTTMPFFSNKQVLTNNIGYLLKSIYIPEMEEHYIHEIKEALVHEASKDISILGFEYINTMYPTPVLKTILSHQPVDIVKLSPVSISYSFGANRSLGYDQNDDSGNTPPQNPGSNGSINTGTSGGTTTSTNIIKF